WIPEGDNLYYRFNYVSYLENKVLTSAINGLEHEYYISIPETYLLEINTIDLSDDDNIYHVNHIQMYEYKYNSNPMSLSFFELETYMSADLSADGLRKDIYGGANAIVTGGTGYENKSGFYDIWTQFKLTLSLQENYIFNGWQVNRSPLIGAEPGTYDSGDIVTTNNTSVITKVATQHYEIIAVFSINDSNLNIFGEGLVVVDKQSVTDNGTTKVQDEQRFSNNAKNHSFKVISKVITIIAEPSAYSEVIVENCYFRYVKNNEYNYFTEADGTLTITENGDGTVSFTYNNKDLYYVEAYIEFRSSTWAVDGNFIGPSGDGTITSPYLISSAKELGWVSYIHSAAASQGTSPSAGKYFKLINNIDLTGHYWLPIGNNESGTWPFAGNFDGNGYTISNMSLYAFENIFYAGNYQMEVVKNIGFFGYTENANIYNLQLSGSVEYRSNGTITRDEDNAYDFKEATDPRKATILNYDVIYMGAIIGNMNNTNIVYVPFNNNVTYIECNVRNDHSYTEVSIGGIIGKASGTNSLQDVGYNSTITINNFKCASSYAGGLVGMISGGNTSIKASRAKASENVLVTGKYVGIVGGLIGKSTATQLTISDSYYNGGISAQNTTTGGIVASGTATTNNVYFKCSLATTSLVGEYRYVSGTYEPLTYNYNYPWEKTAEAPTLWVLDNVKDTIDTSSISLNPTNGEYLITNVTEFKWFVANMATLDAPVARVTADLDFAGTIWSVVESVPENVVLDFSGYTVKNVRVLNGNAMFNKNYGLIKNIVLTESGNYNSFAIGSQAMLVNENHGTIEHVQLNADVVNKHFDQSFNSTQLIVGGAVAQMLTTAGANIQKSYFIGHIDVQADRLNTAYVGGLVGRVNGVQNALISQNYTVTDINVNANSATKLYVAGLIAEIINSNSAQVLDNYAGLDQYPQIKVADNVTADNTLVGTITIPSSFTTTNTVVANVIGAINGTSTNTAVKRIYGVNNVNLAALNLGSIGYIATPANVTINYAYALDSTVNGTPAYGTKESSANLLNKTSGLYDNWDFVDIWTFNELSTATYKYPILQETDNTHTIYITINFELGPFGYVYSEQNEYLYELFDTYGPPIKLEVTKEDGSKVLEDIHYITRVQSQSLDTTKTLYSGITGVVRIPHLKDVTLVNVPNPNPTNMNTYMFLHSSFLDGSNTSLLATPGDNNQTNIETDVEVKVGVKDYTLSFNYKWYRYAVSVDANSYDLGNVSITRVNNEVKNVDEDASGNNIDYSTIVETNGTYLHGELVKLSAMANATAGLLKWQKVGAEDITRYSEDDKCIYIDAPYSRCYDESYDEAAYQAALLEAKANLKEGEYIFDRKTFDLYFYVNAETAGTYKAYFVNTYDVTFSVSPEDYGVLTELDLDHTNNHEKHICANRFVNSSIALEIDGEQYYNISSITTYDASGVPHLKYVEGAVVVVRPRVINTNYKIDRVTHTKVGNTDEVLAIDSNNTATSEDYANHLNLDFSEDWYYHQRAVFTVLTVDSFSAGNYEFKLELIEYKITVVTSKGGAYSAVDGDGDPYTLITDGETSYYSIIGGQDITFSLVPEIRYALAEFNLTVDELPITRPDDYVDKSYLEVIANSENFALNNNTVYDFGDAFIYLLSRVNSDMTLYINYAQYTWYDHGKQPNKNFFTETTGIQIVNGIEYDGTTQERAYQIQTSDQLARVIYLVNSNLSYTNANGSFFYKDAFYKIISDAIDLETKFWSPIGGYTGTSFDGTIFSGTDDYRTTTHRTIKNIYMDPYEITLSNGVVISNLAQFATGIGFIGKSVNGLISNVKLNNVNVVYERETLTNIGGYIGYADGARVFNGQITDGTFTLNTESVAGSIIGYADNGSTIFKVSSNTNFVINSNNCYVGGLVGNNNGLVNASYYNGKIVNNNINVVGGLVGYNNGIINMSYVNANISTASLNNVGVIVGFEKLPSEIINSYFVTGKLDDGVNPPYSGTNEKPVGSWIEDNEDYDIELVGVQDSYKGFNFENIYTMTNNGPVHFAPVFDYTSASLQGSGTKQDPYLIGSSYAFLTFINQINSGDETYNNPNVYYQITANFSMNGFDYQIIEEFNANLNGGGNTITGLHIGTNVMDNVALFRVNNGVIRDVKFEQAVIVGNNNVAGLVVTNNGIIHGVVFDGNIMGRNNVAGIVATNQNGTLVRLGSHAVVAGNTNVGGVVATLIESNVDSYNDVYVFKFDPTTNKPIINYTGLTESYSRAHVVGNNVVGGVVAEATNTTSHVAIKNVYNTGNVYAENTLAGIVGKATNIHILYTYSYGDIVSYSNDATPENASLAEAGHIVGYANNVTIGYVENGSDMGVAIAPNDGKHVYLTKANTFIEPSISSIGNNVGSTVRTRIFDYTTLLQQDTFTQFGFDFINMWRYFDPDPEDGVLFNYGLPILKFFHSHLIKISVNEFGGFTPFLIINGVDVDVNINEDGEIYVLEGDTLRIDFKADTYYHLYEQIVDIEGETKILEPELDERGVPDNRLKFYSYTFPAVKAPHTIHVNFTIDRYKFEMHTICAQVNIPVGAITLLNEDGSINDSGIYNHGEVVKLKVSELDHYRLIGLTHIRYNVSPNNAYASTSTSNMTYDVTEDTVNSRVQVTEEVTDEESGAVSIQNVYNTYVYTHETHDGVYTVDETRKLHTTLINGNNTELNYSTQELTITFIANDYTANGTDASAEACYPAIGHYQAEFIKQYDLQITIKTWIDINIPQESPYVGGTYNATISDGINEYPIVDDTGYGIIDHGTVVTIDSTPGNIGENLAYNFIDYTNGVRPDHEVLSTNKIESFEINETRTIYTNFELRGYDIEIKLGKNGQLILYKQNTVTNEWVPTTFTEPRTYTITIKHGYILKFTSQANPTYAIERVVASESKPDDTQEVIISSSLMTREMEYRNVTGPFSVELTFRRQVWTDFPSEFLLGEGTKENPYLITNGHDLGLIANEVNLNGNTYEGKYFKVYPLDDEGNSI
ncbi:MAG: hypothetical protein IJA69_02635, partial [Clostridia bacterium]|nr:hypothetical protein [Clostridia bacterium]